MLYQGRAIQPGAKGDEAAGSSYRSWWLRSSLSILAIGAGGSLLFAVLTWVALRLGATAVLPTLIGTQAPVGGSPLSEIAAGWTLTFFSSQLVPVQIWAARPPGLGFGLGSPLLLALLIVASFRAGLRLESVSSGGFNSLAASGRASAVAVPQAILVVALLALAHNGSGPLAGAPLPVATVLPVLLVGGAAAAGAAWRRERRLGRSTAAGVRGLGLAGIALSLASALAGILAGFVLLAGIVTGQVRVDGGLGTLLLGLIYLPNGGVLAAAAGLGGGPPLDGALEAGFCGLVSAGCFAVALHVRRRADRLEQIFFAVGFPTLLLIAAVASRPLVSDHTLGFTLGVAFWVAAVISSMAAAAGPFLAELALGSRLAVGRPLGLIADWLPPVPEVDPVPLSALRAIPDRSHLLGQLVLTLTAIVMAGLITLLIVVPAPALATTPEGAIADYLRLEAAGDGPGLWMRTRLDRSGLPAGTDSSLLTAAGLAATLQLPANRSPMVGGVKVVSSRRTLAGTEYQVAFIQGGVRRQRRFTLQSDRVLVQPEVLSIAPAPGLGTVTVDGTSVVDPRRPIGVMPGWHEVRGTGGGLWSAAQLLVPPAPAAPRVAAVSLAPGLTPGALPAAAAAVAESFAGCLASASPVPAGCPQSLPVQPAGPITWQLVGDPAAGATFSGTDESNLTAAGSFQMIGSYAVHVPEGVRHQPSGGGYVLNLHWDGHGFSRGALAAADAPPKPPPAVADGALLDAVAAGFQACLSSNLLRPPDCPQTIPSSLFITRVSWSPDGDPLAGATISYDPAHSIFLVSGSYSFSVSYHAGAKAAAGNSSGSYRGELFWDGKRAVLVDIVKSA